MMLNDVPRLPDNAPSFGNTFSRWLGRVLLRLMGWRIEGELPNIKQLVAAAAPHTSNWDFVVSMCAMLAIGVNISYLMKREAFIWPLRLLFIQWGGIPINRRSPETLVNDICRWYDSHDKLWVIVTPEGTRDKVDKWKTGYLRIAEAAQVPVFLIGWDYRKKVIMLEGLWPTTGDHLKDAEAMAEHVRHTYCACHPERY